MLYDPALKTAVEEEILPLVAENPAASPNLLQERLEECPKLTAIYHETLRTTTSSISAREVVGECAINNLQFQPGARVIIPSRQKLIDSNAFGPNPRAFNVNRFLQSPGLAKC